MRFTICVFVIFNCLFVRFNCLINIRDVFLCHLYIALPQNIINQTFTFLICQTYTLHEISFCFFELGKVEIADSSIVMKKVTIWDLYGWSLHDCLCENFDTFQKVLRGTCFFDYWFSLAEISFHFFNIVLKIFVHCFLFFL